MLIACLVAFISGVVIEASCVMWVHYSERDDAAKTALFSMIVALAQVAGIGEAIHDWHIAPFFVLGYGVGTYTTMKVKTWLKSRKSPD